MPRGPRRNTPGILPHWMGRGSERPAIVRDDWEWADFVRELTGLDETTTGRVAARVCRGFAQPALSEVLTGPPCPPLHFD